MILHGHQGGSIVALRDALRDSPVQLRWGGPCVVGPVINGAANLLSGLAQLEHLRIYGVKVPDFVTQLPDAQRWAREERATIYGRNEEHTQGLDIVLVIDGRASYKYLRSGRLQPTPMSNWTCKDFWSRWTPSLREWRFHVLRNGTEYNSLARAVKVWDGQGPEPSGTDSSHPLVRSRRLGWKMAHDIEPPKGLREAARRAVEACGYDLGAVDLLETTSGPVVLEVNSRPAIRDPYTVDRYAQALRAWKP